MAANMSVMIAVDNSENADHALNFYFDNLYRDGHEVTMVSIHETPHLSAFSLGTPMNLPSEEWMHIMMEHNKKAKDIEEKYQEFIRVKKLPKSSKFVSCQESSSDVGHSLVKYAKDNKMDMIVLGSRGLNAIRRTFMGSTSDYVLHHFERPVVVVPPVKK